MTDLDRTTVKSPEPDWSLFVPAMRAVEDRRALVADVDLPTEYAKAAASVVPGLIADLDYARADARHWHAGWEAATADVARQRQWLNEKSQEVELALLRERSAKEDAATHAEREGAAEGELRQWRFMRQTFVDLAAYALFHGQHDGVSPSDRERILDLVVRVSDFMREHKGGQS